MKCIIVDDDPISVEILKKHIEDEDDLELIASFQNPVEALAHLKKSSCDILFLDIEMPEMNGMEFIEFMNDKLSNVILTTSHSKYAVEAFNFKVSGYLVKPINTASFKKAILKIRDVYSTTLSSVSEDFVFIKKEDAIIKINKRDLNFIECIGDYVILHQDNSRNIIHSTMKAVEERFKTDDFIRVHRSFIVPVSKIENIEDDTIKIKGKSIPIGKTYKQLVYKRLNIL